MPQCLANTILRVGNLLRGRRSPQHSPGGPTTRVRNACDFPLMGSWEGAGGVGSQTDSRRVRRTEEDYMRKSLLAGVAVLGAVGVIQGSAYAQTPGSPPPPPAPVAPAAPLMTLIPLTAGGNGKSANDNNNYQPAPIPGAVATPTPGTFVLRLNGKIWSEYGFGGGSGMVGPTPSS